MRTAVTGMRLGWVSAMVLRETLLTAGIACPMQVGVARQRAGRGERGPAEPHDHRHLHHLRPGVAPGRGACLHHNFGVLNAKLV